MERCSGGLKVSEGALLAMLGGPRFVRGSVVSDADGEAERLRGMVAMSGLGAAASEMGITKSSLKRRIRPAESNPTAYDETNPVGMSRKYLEGCFGSWRVVNLDARRFEACLETRTGVRLSVEVPRQATSGI